MNGVEIDYALSHLTLLVDTREQDTIELKKRLQSAEIPYIREKLDFGDYSIKSKLLNGCEFSLQNKVCVERKMSIDELCNCYCQQRQRFEREFERAKEAGAKVYLLVENATFEKIYNHKYKSQMSPNALSASVLAWLSRYNCQIVFCKPETSGKLIKDILYREMKEFLNNFQGDKK